MHIPKFANDYGYTFQVFGVSTSQRGDMTHREVYNIGNQLTNMEFETYFDIDVIEKIIVHHFTQIGCIVTYTDVKKCDDDDEWEYIIEVNYVFPRATKEVA